MADEAGKMETVSEQAATVLCVWYQPTVAAAMSDQAAMLQSASEQAAMSVIVPSNQQRQRLHQISIVSDHICASRSAEACGRASRIKGDDDRASEGCARATSNVSSYVRARSNGCEVRGSKQLQGRLSRSKKHHRRPCCDRQQRLYRGKQQRC